MKDATQVVSSSHAQFMHTRVSIVQIRGNITLAHNFSSSKQHCSIEFHVQMYWRDTCSCEVTSAQSTRFRIHVRTQVLKSEE